MMKFTIGEIAASIRCNLYRSDPNMPAYPVGIVEAVLAPLFDNWENELAQMSEHAKEGWELAHAHMYRADGLREQVEDLLVEKERLEARLSSLESRSLLDG